MLKWYFISTSGLELFSTSDIGEMKFTRDLFKEIGINFRITTKC